MTIWELRPRWIESAEVEVPKNIISNNERAFHVILGVDYFGFLM
jgi:hypothetical protein